MRFIKALVAYLFLTLTTTTSVFAVSLPPLPAGYETWTHQERFCVLIKKDGEKGKYRLDLYQLQLPEKKTFESVEVHFLNGEPYLVSYFGSRRTVRGYIPLEQRPFEVYRRTKQTFFVRVAKENKWQEFVNYPDTMDGVRGVVLAIVDRDFLSARGTSTNEIKECLRVQSRNNRK